MVDRHSRYPGSAVKDTEFVRIMRRFAAIPGSYFWVTLVVFSIHVLGRHSDYSLATALLAGVGGAIVAVVMLAMFYRKQAHLPVLEWSLIQYYIFWISPVFFPGESGEIVSFSVLRRSGNISLAMFGVIVFMVSVLGAFLLLQTMLPRRRPPRPSRPGSSMLLVVMAVVSLVATYFVLMRESEGLSYFYVVFVIFSPTLFLLLLLFERRQFRASGVLHLGFYTTLVGAIIVGLVSSRLTYVILPFVVVILVQISGSKRITWGYILLVVMLVVLLNPAKIMYRDLTGFRTSEFARLSVVESVDALKRSMEMSWGSSHADYEGNIEDLGDRLNMLSRMGAVFYAVPTLIPYEEGTTIFPVVYGLIPRVLWKEKPSITAITTDHFNIKLGFQTYAMTLHTTETMPMVAEGYFNFGWPGIIGLGACCGLVFAVLSWLFSPGNRLFFVSTFYVVATLQPARGFVSSIGPVWKVFLVAVIWSIIVEQLGKRRRVTAGVPVSQRLAEPAPVDGDVN